MGEVRSHQRKPEVMEGRRNHRSVALLKNNAEDKGAERVRRQSRSQRSRMDTQNQSILDKNMETDFVTEEQTKQTEQRSCLFPPLSSHLAQKREESASIVLNDQQRKIDQRCLLEELARIEQDLKETIQREEKKQQELDQVRREENRIHWRSLLFLSLNQRTAKPWVTSYYKNIPMHIYCLPIETVVRNQNKKKTRR